MVLGLLTFAFRLQFAFATQYSSVVSVVAPTCAHMYTTCVISPLQGARTDITRTSSSTLAGTGRKHGPGTTDGHTG
jgi:hypothetical protein